MVNEDPCDGEADLSGSSHAHFEGYGLDTKDKKNCVSQGGPRKRNKTNKWKNETLDNEYVGATPYVRVATVDAICTMLLQESVPTATTRVIESITGKVRDSSYEIDSHAATCLFGRGTLIVYDFNWSVNV